MMRETTGNVKTADFQISPALVRLYQLEVRLLTGYHRDSSLTIGENVN
jgi:hypothetical protein